MEKNHGDQHSYTLGRIKEIRAIHKREVKGVSDAAQNLRDEAAVFVDILPGYKIKELTEADKKQMKSKDVRSLQDIEQKILFYYRKFLGNLIGLAHNKNEDAQLLAVDCMSELLPVAQDFNFGKSIIDIVVDRASSRAPRIANICVSAVRTLLSAPHPTDAVLSCLQCISDQVKERKHLVSHRLLASLVCVRIRVMDVHARDIKREKKMKQQQKAKDKELAKQMERGEAEVSRVQLAKLQTNMLNKVITTYLRTLECCKEAPRYRQSMLLGPTMEGLAKFAPMIDYSLFELLMQAIWEVMETESATLAAILNGIITVATLANTSAKDSSSDGVAVDIAPYYERLYAVLPAALDVSSQHDERSRVDEEQQFDAQGNLTDDATTAVSMVAPRGKKSDPPRNTLKERAERARLALRACELMLLEPKKLPLQRVAAFFRRLEILSTHSPPHVSIALLALCRRLLQKYPGLAQLHDGGEEAASGAYDPMCEVPDHVNAMSTMSWELHLLRHSYHPTLREYAATLLRQHRGLATNGQKAATLNATVMGVTFDKALQTYGVAEGGFSPLPQEVNRKMDRAALKRRQQAEVALERERIEAAAREEDAGLYGDDAFNSAEAPPAKKKPKKVIAALEDV